MENGDFGMPSFTLCPCGKERSRIKRHLPGWLFFGITPMVNGGLEKGLAILPRATSNWRYSSITPRCSREERMFDDADFREPARAVKPMQNPSIKLKRTYATADLSR